MAIITQKSLFLRFAQMLAIEDKHPKSNRLKWQTDGAPTVFIAHTIEDWDLEAPAAYALAGCGVDAYTDWSWGRLFMKPKDDDWGPFRSRLSMLGSWLAVIVSERTPLDDKIPWILEVAKEEMIPGRYALLPVRYSDENWSLPESLRGYARIEEIAEELCLVRPDSATPLPLADWLKMPR